MRWLEIRVKTPAGRADAVAEELTARGITGLVIEDEADFLRFLKENRQYWDYVDDALSASMRGRAQVKFYLPEGTPEEPWRAALSGLDCVEVETTLLDEDDWGNAYKRYYQPLAAGKRLYIVPAWLDAAVPDGRTALRLNPGLTFGTGGHATTQLCLAALERHVKAGDTVLDLGCGSGILSVAALLLCAKNAVAVDIDPNAEAAARENAALNGIAPDRYQIHVGDVLHGAAQQPNGGGLSRYPVILANIVADVILALAPRVGDWLSEGGVFLCSGILGTRADEVEQGLTAAGWRVTEREEQDGWAAMTCRRDGTSPATRARIENK